MAEPASRKERIMREATRLYGSADPPSVNAIAQAAGVSRSTLYRIFPRRTTLLDALEVAPGPGTRQRVLEAAWRLLASRSLAGLAVDALGTEAGGARGHLSRLFPRTPDPARA